MDPYTGEIWRDDEIAALREVNEQHAVDLEARLVKVEGTDEALAELHTNVAAGALARKQAKQLLDQANLRHARGEKP